MRRSRSVVRSTFAIYFYSFVSVIGGIITIPVLTKALSAEEFGLYQLLISYLLYISFLDFGISASLINLIGISHIKLESDSLSKWMSSGFQAVILTTVLFVLLTVWLPFTPIFLKIIKIPEYLYFTAKVGFLIVVLSASLSYLLKFFYTLLIATQRLFIGQLIAASVSIITTLLIVIGGVFRWPMLAFLFSFCTGGVILGAACFLWIKIFDAPLLNHLRLLPVTKSSLIDLYRNSIGFIAHQVSGLALGYLPPLILAARSNLKEIAIFSVSYRVLMLIGSTITSFDLSLWPAILDARSKDDWPWITEKFGLSLTYAITTSSVILTFIAPWFPLIIGVWAGEYVTPSYSLTIGLVIYFGVIYPWNNLQSKINSAFERQLNTSLAALLLALLYVIISWYFAPHVGSISVPIGLIIASLLTVSWFLPRDTHKVFPHFSLPPKNIIIKWFLSILLALSLSITTFYLTEELDRVTRLLVGFFPALLIGCVVLFLLWFGKNKIISFSRTLLAKFKILI